MRGRQEGVSQRTSDKVQAFAHKIVRLGQEENSSGADFGVGVG